MPNGQIGDNPVSDILTGARNRLRPKINALIHEVQALRVGRDVFDNDGELRALLFDAQDQKSLELELERKLLAIRDRLS